MTKADNRNQSDSRVTFYYQGGSMLPDIWNVGILEYWKAGKGTWITQERLFYLNPLFHHSILPLFQIKDVTLSQASSCFLLQKTSE